MKALEKILGWYQFQQCLNRDMEYKDISTETLLSLISENVKRLTLDIEVLRGRVNDEKDKRQADTAPDGA